MSGSEILEQLRGVFFEEALEGLETMERSLMLLDDAPADLDAINQIFRAAHSIKGGAGSFGFEAVARFTHGLETVLDALRSNARAVDAACIDTLLRSVDHLRSLVDGAATDTSVDEAQSLALTRELEALLPEQHDSDGDDEKKATPDRPLDQGAFGYRIGFVPEPDLMATGNDPVLIFRELRTLGALEVTPDTSGLPGLDDLDPETMYLGWSLLLTTVAEERAVREVFEWVEGECELTLERVEAARPAGPPAGDEGPSAVRAPPETKKGRLPVDPSSDGEGGSDRAPLDRATERSLAEDEPGRAGGGSAGEGADPGPRPSNRPKDEAAPKARGPKAEAASIRVGTEKIDALMDIVGELVITQSMLCQIEKEFDLGKLDKLRDGLGELARNTRELQESVMRIRMLPISSVFSRFPRLVRDVRSSLGKRVELELVGEGTEVDKTVSEQLADPLVHLVRNALDHGLEAPEARREAGKPETGRIRLAARHQGGNIVIEVSDDGRGIDPEKVLAKAKSRGLVEKDERLSEERIYELLFLPGFSTADRVSALSGRGVGLDVVARNIRSLGGAIETESELGRGTCFRIRLPLTLSILDGQLLRVGSQIFVLPLLSIVESVQVDDRHVNRVAGRGEIYRLREHYIPMIRADQVFGVKRGPEDGRSRLLVVVEGDGSRAGLLVDELLDQQQVVVKSLETNFRPVPGMSGATILGDGQVVLIVDVAGLMRLARGHKPEDRERKRPSGDGPNEMEIEPARDEPRRTA